MWQWQQLQQIPEQIYVPAGRTAFKRPNHWEPWNEDRIPAVRFIEYFRISRVDFKWLCKELRGELQQDALGRGEPLTVEAQVAVGLYQVGHGATYVNIGHVFNIGKETAEKASARFVKAVLRVLSICLVRELLSRMSWKLMQLCNACDISIQHVPLAVPPHDKWKGYINQKNWSSIVFQCVVDGDGNFCNVSGGGPGSMHNTRVFRRSFIGQSLLGFAPPMIPPRAMLVGDAGYPGAL
ncbi:hypothetical protein PTTG_09303 [Puccinia triticina 1-1 BBBD Race 1]|uniref:DDE Tnp4 domain-containing protein n=1 Tax=Puccinia triticina (isolate 1-1 / race 1 (BBBD)) TaxID=630390 RepID=A0A180H4G6_PUCT1|nr:hypothetical protein PTTG_09303 [Puccinia triticina 1-1 BBBD Race 1]